jgi:hypothetical protein
MIAKEVYKFDLSNSSWFSGMERSPVVEDLLGNITLHFIRQGFHVAQFLCQANCNEIFTRVEMKKIMSAVL